MFDIPAFRCNVFSASKAAIDRPVSFASPRIEISRAGAGHTQIASSGR
jgi:hypothetical protein